jgi:hypothetical protein
MDDEPPVRSFAVVAKVGNSLQARVHEAGEGWVSPLQAKSKIDICWLFRFPRQQG